MAVDLSKVEKSTIWQMFNITVLEAKDNVHQHWLPQTVNEIYFFSKSSWLYSFMILSDVLHPKLPFDVELDPVCLVCCCDEHKPPPVFQF